MADLDPPAKDSQRTRQAILRAAQRVFSTRGYRDAGVREITALAGVSIALVNRYFGSKEKLFEEALADLLNPATISNMPRERFGQAIVDLLVGGIGLSEVPLPMIMLASGDPGARAITQRLLTDLVYHPLAEWLGPEEGRVRAARFMIVSAGLTVYRHIYPLDILVPEPDPAIRDWLIQQFQVIAD